MTLQKLYTLSITELLLILVFCINTILFSGTRCVCRVWSLFNSFILVFFSYFYNKSASVSFQYEWWFGFWRRAGEGSRYSMNIDAIFDRLINGFTLWEERKTQSNVKIMNNYICRCCIYDGSVHFRQVYSLGRHAQKMTWTNWCSLLKISHSAIQ